MHHFADDTNLFHTIKSLKNLNKLVNHMKHLNNWLNASKISLNIEKTGLVIFKSPRKVLLDEFLDDILDLYCIRLSSAAPCCENHAKLYFHAKHLEQGLNRGKGEILGALFS